MFSSMQRPCWAACDVRNCSDAQLAMVTDDVHDRVIKIGLLMPPWSKQVMVTIKVAKEMDTRTITKVGRCVSGGAHLDGRWSGVRCLFVVR